MRHLAVIGQETQTAEPRTNRLAEALRRWATQCLALVPVVAALASLVCGCGSPVGEDSGAPGSVRQHAIRPPIDQHESDELGPGQVALDSSGDYDDRRDVWEDEWPSIGEDPTLWDQQGEQHQSLHGTRKVRKYGYQWLRSYARSASVALFHADDVISNGDGTFTLRQYRERLTPGTVAELERAASGWDLCPEERFYDQTFNRSYANTFCSGTLVAENVVLTAAHCFRDENTNEIKEDKEPAKLRVVFDYRVSQRGEIPHIVKASSVYRVRELLSVHPNVVDFALLELLDESGNPTTANDEYVPVPIWESNSRPPGNHLLWRQAAAIGVGAKLPQKISINRSWGWKTDPAFYGLNLMADLYAGNSGGGTYDVETGTLIGVVKQQYDPEVSFNCPADPSQSNWPECWSLPPATHRVIPLLYMPRFSGTTSDSWRGCMQWASHAYTAEHQLLFEELMTSHWRVDNADVRGGEHWWGESTSIKAIRRLACEPSDSTEPYYDALRAVTQLVVNEAEEVVSHPEAHCEGEGACPSPMVIASKLMFDKTPGFFHSYLGDPRDVLSSTRLCTGTVAQPPSTEWLDVPQLYLEEGREMTVHGTSVGALDYFESGADFGTPTPDVLYRLTVSEHTILYADTFSGGLELGEINPGTNFDTSLAVLESDSTDDHVSLDPSNWQNQEYYWDDSKCAPDILDKDADVEFRFQSQLVYLLRPGKKYLLMVTGANGAYGDFNLHVQTIPGPKKGHLLIPADAAQQDVSSVGGNYHIFAADVVLDGASEQNCTDPFGDEDDYDETCVYNTVHPKLVCQGRDTGEVAVIAVSCPEFDAPMFYYRVVGESTVSSNYGDDPVAAFWEGHATHGSTQYVCSDDITVALDLGPFGTLSQRYLASQIGHAQFSFGGILDSAETYLNSGAAVRGFYSHQWDVGLNWDVLSYTLQIPVGAVHDWNAED